MAEEVEDLHPDHELWEEVRTIMFDGLTSSSSSSSSDDDDDDGDAAMRYLRAHENLHEKCRGDASALVQLWDMVRNLLGAILVLSRRSFEEEEGEEEDGASSSSSSSSRSSSSSSSTSDRSLDFCFDVVRTTLSVLSRTACDHVVSGVGREREVETTLLGMSIVLSDDLASSIWDTMDPYAGTFEVWSRFVDPGKFVSIVQASGLGGAAFRRCEEEQEEEEERRRRPPSVANDGRNVPTEGGRIRETTTTMARVRRRARVDASRRTSCSPPFDDRPPLADVKRCASLQSLSILRIIVFRCHGPREVVFAMRRRERPDIRSTDMPFLSPRGGIVGSDDARSIIEKAEEHRKLQCGQRPNQLDVDEGIGSVLEPFLRVIRAKESDEVSIDRDLELLCTQTISLLRRPYFQ